MMEFVEEKPKFGDHHSIRRRWVNREHAYTITENLLADNKTVYKAYVGSGHTINLLFNHDVLKKEDQNIILNSDRPQVMLHLIWH